MVFEREEKRKMKIVTAIDSMKGSLSSREASEAAAEGIRRVDPAAQIAACPVADGGEGTVEAMTEALGGSFRRVSVTGPLGEPVECTYGWIPQKQTAILEMAGAAGLPLVPESQRNPMETTTYGVGEVIRDAIACGCRKLIIGIGGSATNDGGAGMLQALGYELLDDEGTPIPRKGSGLACLRQICSKNRLPELDQCQFLVACDVTNPLCGPSGCSAVYGPQKGADKEIIEKMDGWLGRFAALTGQILPASDPEAPGAGAAGGLGFAFASFLGAVLEPGISIVLRETGMEEQIRTADLVITGEGRLDGQTAMGKTPVGVARLAKKYGKPVVALGGSVLPEAGACHQEGIDAMFSILPGPTTLEKAMEPQQAKENLAGAAEQVYRLWSLGRQ